MSIQSLKDFSAALQKLPATLGKRVAEIAAPKLTELARATYNASQDPYGKAWAPSVVDGSTVDLKETGAMYSQLVYEAVGPKVKVDMAAPYAKYQVGKRPVFPKANATLPVSYLEVLQQATSDTIKEQLVK